MILNRLEKHQGEIATSSVTWHEILYGAGIAKSARKRDLIEKYLREVVGPTIPVLPYDTRAAEAHAAERARLSPKGPGLLLAARVKPSSTCEAAARFP